MPLPVAPAFSGLSVISASVVRIMPAIDAAFSTAERVTLAGSMIPRLDHVDVLAQDHVVADVGVLLLLLAAAHQLDHDRAILAGVARDAAQRLFERAAQDVDAGLHVALGLRRASSAESALSRATPPPGTMPFFDRRAGRAQRVLDAVLLLLQLGLGRGADLDDGHAAGQLGQPLLQLLAVEVGGRRLDLGADLLDAALDRGLVARALDDGGVVLGRDDAAGAAEILDASRCRACGRSPRR